MRFTTGFGGVVQGEEIVDAVDVAIGDVREQIAQVGFEINMVEFAAADQAVDGRGAFAAGIGTSE